MKYVLVGFICLSVAVSGCQSYPKNPTSPKVWGKKEAVNKTVPSELQPYAVFENVTYVDEKKVVPKKIIVTSPDAKVE